MREDFETASSFLIEVDLYRRSSRGTGRNADVSSTDFKAGRISSGVDLQCHPKEYFVKISPEQKVECLIDSITCTDSAFQAAIGLVRANTNNMIEDFEAAASSLIEVNPHRRTSRSTGRNADVSSIDFKDGRGSS